MKDEIISESANNFQSGFSVIIEKSTGLMVFPTPDDANFKRVANILKQTIDTKDKTIIYYEQEKKFFKKNFFPVDDKYVKFEFIDITSIYKKYISALETVESLQIDFTTRLPIKKKLFDDIADYLLYALNSGEEFGLIMYDLDDFKKVNDILGHKYGDVVLREISNITKNSIRHDIYRSKDIIGRFGGEEFVLLVKGINSKTMEAIAERIRHNIELLDAKMPITVSLGCIHSSDMRMPLDLLSFKKEDEEEVERERLMNLIDSIINLADVALYYSKHHGKNQSTNYGLLPETEMNVNQSDELSKDNEMGTRRK